MGAFSGIHLLSAIFVAAPVPAMTGVFDMKWVALSAPNEGECRCRPW